MKKAYFSTIFFCAVLIFSIYSIPTNYGQAAFAHQDPAHEKCWMGGFSPEGGFKGGFFGPYDLISFIGGNIVLALNILGIALLAFIITAPFGPPVLALIPPIKVGFFVIKQISYVGGAALAAFGCEPLLVPPPVTEAGTVHLDCTNEEGFQFTEITSDFDDRLFTLHENSPPADIFGVPITVVETFGFFEPIIQATEDDKFDKVLPVVYWYSLIGPLFNILIILVINLLFDISDLPSPAAEPPGAGAAKDAAKQTAKKEGIKFLKGQATSIFKNLAKNLLKARETVKTAPGSADLNPFSWQDRAELTLPRDAYTTHPFHPIVKGGVKNPGGGTFELGKNSLTYFAKAHLTDESIFPFNVYDSEAPEIIFRNETGSGEQGKEVTLEANAHYGFKVNSRTLPLVKLGSTVFDECDLNPTFDYIGPKFFLLTKIKENQYAPWKTTDHPPAGGYYALTPSDVIRVLDTEIGALTAADYQPIRTAGVDPSQTIEFSTVSEKFSTARHLFSVATNAEINELLANNTKKVPPTADPKIGNLADAITLDEIDILGSPKLDEEALTIEVKDDPLRLDNISEETKNALLALARDPSIVDDNTVIENVRFDRSSGIAWTFADSFLYGNARPSSIASTERPNPNVFADFQIITVLDTIAPNILVTEDIAIGVHNVTSTLTSQEDYPNLFDETGSCTGTEEADNIECKLKIRPPAIFDIADPFPTIILNITASKPSNSIPFF